MQKYDSNLEKHRYQELLPLEKAGYIRDLCFQQSFDIFVRGQYITTYTPDINYYVVETGLWCIEECKGYFHKTDRLRFKLFLAHVYKEGESHVYLQDSQHNNGLFFQVRLTKRGQIQGLFADGWKAWRFNKDLNQSNGLYRGKRSPYVK